VYNSQPWRWRASTSDGIDLFADPNRHLITTDPDGRDLLLMGRARYARRHELDPLSPPRLAQRAGRQPAAGPVRLLVNLAQAASVGSVGAMGRRWRHLVRTVPTVISRSWWATRQATVSTQRR
jgi:hypothetical protein